MDLIKAQHPNLKDSVRAAYIKALAKDFEAKEDMKIKDVDAFLDRILDLEQSNELNGTIDVFIGRQQKYYSDYIDRFIELEAKVRNLPDKDWMIDAHLRNIEDRLEDVKTQGYFTFDYDQFVQLYEQIRYSVNSLHHIIPQVIEAQAKKQNTLLLFTSYLDNLEHHIRHKNGDQSLNSVSYSFNDARTVVSDMQDLKALSYEDERCRELMHKLQGDIYFILKKYFQDDFQRHDTLIKSVVKGLSPAID